MISWMHLHNLNIKGLKRNMMKCNGNNKMMIQNHDHTL